MNDTSGQKIKNEAELIPDEVELTFSHRNKSEKIKKIEEYFRKGLVKIPDVTHFILEGTHWTPPPWWYVEAMAYRKKYNTSDETKTDIVKSSQIGIDIQDG